MEKSEITSNIFGLLTTNSPVPDHFSSQHHLLTSTPSLEAFSSPQLYATSKSFDFINFSTLQMNLNHYNPPFHL